MAAAISRKLKVLAAILLDDPSLGASLNLPDDNNIILTIKWKLYTDISKARYIMKTELKSSTLLINSSPRKQRCIRYSMIAVKKAHKRQKELYFSKSHHLLLLSIDTNQQPMLSFDRERSAVPTDHSQS